MRLATQRQFPAQEFDRTTVETFQQIRSDMLQLQQQIVALDKKLADGSQPTIAFSNVNLTGADEGELLRSMFSLFQGVIATESVRQTLREENPALLNRVEALLQTVEAELKDESQAPRAKVRT